MRDHNGVYKIFIINSTQYFYEEGNGTHITGTYVYSVALNAVGGWDTTWFRTQPLNGWFLATNDIIIQANCDVYTDISKTSVFFAKTTT